MKKLAVIIFLLAILFAACQQHRALSDAIAEADAVICTNPDSALAILSRADTTGAPDRLRAHYALLSEKASNKAFIDNTDDSLISTAARFYQGRDDSLEAQALYYKGVVQANNRDFSRALISLMQAHDVADRANDRFYKAMSNRTLADIYNKLLAFDAAARCDSLAIIEFYDAGRDEYAIIEELYYPFYLVQSGRLSEADSLLDLNALNKQIYDSPKCMAWYYQTRALASISHGDNNLAASWYDSCFNNVPDYVTSDNWSRAATNQLIKNDIESALKFLALARDHAKDSEDSLYFNLTMSRLAAGMGDYEYAYKLQDSIYRKFNVSRDKLLTHPYTTVLTDYFKTLSEDRQQNFHNAKIKINFLIVLVILALILAVGTFLQYKRKKHLNEIITDNLISDIQRLKDELDQKELNTQSAPSILDTMPSVDWDNSFIRLVDHLFAIEENAPSSAEGDAHLRKTFRSTLDSLKSKASLDDIESLANLYSSNLISRFRAEVSILSEKQLKYLSLLILGFSNSSICYILGIKNLNALHQLRARIKSNIEKSQTANKELFISTLKIKKHT